MTENMVWFTCCEHCECPSDDLTGHDDTCIHGCNDGELAFFEETNEETE